MLENIKVGLTNKVERMVTDQNTAAAAGSGALPVFATPQMISMMEQAAFQLLKGEPICEDSVGTYIEVRHTRGCLPGNKVWAVATITNVDRRAVDFEVVAYDQKGEIGRGRHSRFCVDANKFLQKLIDSQ